MPDRLRKWNGWGYEGEGIPTERVARWLKAVEPWLRVSPKDYQPPVPLESLQIPPSRIALEIPGFQGALLATDYERALHAAGRSFGDLVRLRTGQDLCFPDAVAYPEDEADLLRLLEVAEHRSIALIPYGGGTSWRRDLRRWRGGARCSPWLPWGPLGGSRPDESNSIP
jgi:alkyldihydroxyacetonephosphate synthase